MAPDNGILGFILQANKGSKIVSVTNDKHFLKNVSHTFHGGDIYATVGAHLCNGVSPQKLGPKGRPGYTKEAFIHVEKLREIKYHGKVLHIDHFGNVITDFVC